MAALLREVVEKLIWSFGNYTRKMGSSDLTKWKIHIMFYFVSDYGVGMHRDQLDTR